MESHYASGNVSPSRLAARSAAACALTLIVCFVVACGGGGGGGSSTSTGFGSTTPAASTYTLAVSGPASASMTGGTVTGGIASAPTAISCGTTCSQTYSTGAMVTLTETPASLYAFAGWGGACSGTTTSCTVTMAAAEAVTAAFTSTTVLTVSPTPSNGTVTSSSPSGISCGAQGSLCSTPFAPLSSVTLTETPSAGYTFSGWTGACSSAGTASTCVVQMSQARSVSATFTATPVTYSLTVTEPGTGHGSVTASAVGISCANTGSGGTGTCSASGIAANTVVNLTASTVAGYGYVWSGACSGQTCSVTMSSNQTATVTFVPNLLTVTDAGAGTGTVTYATGGLTCGSSGTCTSTTCTSGTCTASVTDGATVTLSASPGTGFAFSGWSGACTGVGSCVITNMTSSKTATASFISSSVCQQTGSSTTLATLVGNSTGTGFTSQYTLQSPCSIETSIGAVNGICYGNYVVQPNTYGNPPANTTFSMWSNSASCWSINQSEPTNTEVAGNPTYWNAPVATRGFSQGPVTLMTPSGGLQVSTLNTEYNTATTPCPSSGASQSVCAKWTMSVPGVSANSVANTSTNFYTTWDALMDIYFHPVAQPAVFAVTSFDLQIYQMLMDFQASGSPAWADFIFGQGHYTTKTISGVQYYVNVNMGDPGSEGAGWVGRNSGGTYNCVSLVPVSSTPTTLTAGNTGSYLWGVPSVVHDVGGIIQWLSTTTTMNGTTGIHDDAGNLLYDNVRHANVTTALLNPAHYLTGFNPGYEVVQTTGTSTYPNNSVFTTTNLWIALPGETVGN